MKKITLLILLFLFLINIGCVGSVGLKYINLDEQSDTDWKTEEHNQNEQKTH